MASIEDTFIGMELQLEAEGYDGTTSAMKEAELDDDELVGALMEHRLPTAIDRLHDREHETGRVLLGLLGEAFVAGVLYEKARQDG